MHRWLLGTFLATCFVVSVACASSAAAPAAKPAAPAPASQPAAQQPAAVQPAVPQPAAAAPAPAAKPATESPKPAEAAPAQPAAAAKPAGESRRLIMGTTNATSSAYSYYVAVAKLLNSKIPTISITAVESGASVENARRIEKGEYDLALVTADTQYQSYHGLAAFKDTPNKELRGLWIRTVIPNAMVVREDSGVKRIEDLNGREFNPGMRGSSTENAHRRAFEVLGIQPKWYLGGNEDSVAAVKDKRIVGYSKALSEGLRDASLLDLMTATKIRILGFTDDQMQKILEAYPFFSPAPIPAGAFEGEWNRQAILTIASISATATTTRIPEDLRLPDREDHQRGQGGTGVGNPGPQRPGLRQGHDRKLANTTAQGRH